MKYISRIIGLVFIIGNAILILSCEPANNNNQNERIELPDGSSIAKTDSANTYFDFNVIKKYKGDFNGSSYVMIEIEHDACRYLVMEGYGETLEFKHKPNCKNKYHTILKSH